MICLELILSAIRFFFDGEEDPVKRIKEEHKEKRAVRSFEESLKKEITISKEDFMNKAAKVVSGGRFMEMATKKDPGMGTVLMLAVSLIISELVTELFDKEEDK